MTRQFVYGLFLGLAKMGVWVIRWCQQINYKYNMKREVKRVPRTACVATTGDIYSTATIVNKIERQASVDHNIDATQQRNGALEGIWLEQI